MTKKIKVKIVNSDSSTVRMFREWKSHGYEFAVMSGDIHSRPDLICFTGGEDVNPKLYGERAIYGTFFNDRRDEEEIKWFKRYFDVPKVGICRGGQLLNVLSGGSMWQDVNNHGRSHGMINLLPIPDRRVAGEELRVSSTHHQMMIPGLDGETLAIAMNDKKSAGLANAYTSASTRDFPEFDTEVVWYGSSRSLCYQPHPEYANQEENQRYFFDLLDYFFFSD